MCVVQCGDSKQALPMTPILSFIESHGFRCIVRADLSQLTITVFIPFTSPHGNGYESVNVRTMSEARAALGY